jgi:hypothetical protein
MVGAWQQDQALPDELRPERADWQQTRAGRRIAASAAELGFLARLSDDLRGIDHLAGWLGVARVDESKEASRSSPPALGGRSAKPGMVAEPGRVGFLAVQVCLLFAG